MLDLINHFGQVEINKDKQFVKTGTASAKLIPNGQGSKDYSKKLILRQYLSILDGGKYKDLGKYTHFLADIYNDSDKEVSMTMNLLFDRTEINEQTFGLKPKQWTKILFEVKDILGYVVDLAKCDALNFVFERPKADEEAPVLYLDDVAIIKDENKKSDYSLTFDAPVEQEDGSRVYEFCNFDKLYQEYVIKPVSKWENLAPKLSINTDMKYSDGNGSSLKVVAPVSSGYNGGVTYPGFEFTQYYIAATQFHKSRDTDSFSFRVYNASNVRQQFLVGFVVRGAGRFYNNTGLYVNPGEWATHTITFAQINANRSGATTELERLEIMWEEFIGTEARTFYFDSFRITQAA